ncbi:MULTISPECIES: acyl-CoA carboxylase epsilon subunit [unclassified Ornithinimicrobium]|uniref:acyl-CoA carboxylase epsilon subunit n=1 Tax=unclassified Ornithinimicrobium TaxID=2615080 RepID=UPI0038540FDF
MSTDETPAALPVIRVERGRPTPEQLAALTVVLAAAAADHGPADGSTRLPRTMWTERSRFARPRPAVGAGGWRASSLPR